MKPAKFDYVRPQSLKDAVALLAPASIPMGRIAEVEEVANLFVMLASPLMEMVNGTMIEIDGGRDKPLMDSIRDKNR